VGHHLYFIDRTSGQECSREACRLLSREHNYLGFDFELAQRDLSRISSELAEVREECLMKEKESRLEIENLRDEAESLRVELRAEQVRSVEHMLTLQVIYASRTWRFLSRWRGARQALGKSVARVWRGLSVGRVRG